MDVQDDLGRSRIDVRDHFLDEGPYDPLLEPGVAAGVSPDLLKVASQFGEFVERMSHRRVVTTGLPLDATLQGVDLLEGPIPATFQLVGDQAVRGIDGIELPAGPVGRVSGRLEVASEGRHRVVMLTTVVLVGRHRRLQCPRLHHTQRLATDRVVHRLAPEGDAPRLRVVDPATVAAVSRDVVTIAGIVHRQFAAATSAPQ